ncbi:serine/threonine-protein kinase [Actinomadura welshii]
MGDYRIIARLGAGGMGSVFLGRSSSGRTVAVKFVHADLARDPAFLTRFRHEVEAARRVSGPWTAPVLDADTEAATPWVATGYVAGPTLQGAVGEYGPLPEPSVRTLGAGLAEALREVHGAGLIHRDLKPSNVLLALDGPRVIDFGIARAVDGTVLTRTGGVVGTPGYMSPEQVRGERVTAASDVFSLGAVLAFAATGRQPFDTGEGGIPSLLYRVVAEPPDLDGMDGPLRGLAEHCLAKDPADRPAPAQILDLLPAPAQGPWLPAHLLDRVGRDAVELLELDPAPDEPPASQPIKAARNAPATLPPTRPYTGAAPPPPGPGGFPPGPGPLPPGHRPPPPPAGSGGGAPAAPLIAGAVALAVILAGALGVLVFRTGGGDESRAGTSPSGSSRKSPENAVPAAFVGTWEGRLDNGQFRRMVIKQGPIGADVVTTRTTDDRTRCEGKGTVVSAEPRILRVSTRVTESDPPGRCSSVGAQMLKLQDKGSVQWGRGGLYGGTLHKK